MLNKKFLDQANFELQVREEVDTTYFCWEIMLKQIGRLSQYLFSLILELTRSPL